MRKTLTNPCILCIITMLYVLLRITTAHYRVKVCLTSPYLASLKTKEGGANKCTQLLKQVENKLK